MKDLAADWVLAWTEERDRHSVVKYMILRSRLDKIQAPVKAIQVFINQVEHLKNPPIAATQILEKFRKNNLQNTANLLENLL